jgi:glycosyltransferase involved in cell wall biosynthesis
VAWSGGTFVRCLALAEGLALKGHNATLVTTSRKARWMRKRLTHEGVSIVEYPAVLPGRARSGWDPFDVARRLVGVMRGEFGNPDVVHAFDSRPAVILPAIALVKSSRAPLVIDWADWWGRGGTIESRGTGILTRLATRRLETWFEETFRVRATRSTVITTALAERARGLGVGQNTITVLPQGCDSIGIVPTDVKLARLRCGIPDGFPIVGYVGTLLKEDASLLFSSFTSLRAVEDRLRLLLIGNPRLPLPEIPGLLRTGFVPRAQLSDYLGACDLFLLPLSDTIANRGRWPSKVNDYLSSGRPTVATPVGDLQHLFAHNEVGMLGRMNDGTFVSSCLTLLADPEARARLGRNARSIAETELSWPRICDSLVSVYLDALRARSHAG